MLSVDCWGWGCRLVSDKYKYKYWQIQIQIQILTNKNTDKYKYQGLPVGNRESIGRNGPIATFEEAKLLDKDSSCSTCCPTLDGSGSQYVHRCTYYHFFSKLLTYSEAFRFNISLWFSSIFWFNISLSTYFTVNSEADPSPPTLSFWSSVVCFLLEWLEK